MNDKPSPDTNRDHYVFSEFQKLSMRCDFYLTCPKIGTSSNPRHGLLQATGEDLALYPSIAFLEILALQIRRRKTNSILGVVVSFWL